MYLGGCLHDGYQPLFEHGKNKKHSPGKCDVSVKSQPSVGWGKACARERARCPNGPPRGLKAVTDRAFLSIFSTSRRQQRPLLLRRHRFSVDSNGHRAGPDFGGGHVTAIQLRAVVGELQAGLGDTKSPQSLSGFDVKCLA